MKKPSPLQYSLLGTSALLAALSFSVVADAKLSKTGSASAGFKATGPGGLNIEGKTSDVSVADDGSTVTITVSLSNIDTGVSLRNKHTKEDLEADKHPTAELKVARSALRFPAAGAESSGDAKGTFKIHGQAKDVTFKYKAKRDGDVISVEGHARLTVGDFGVKPRSYLGISIKPDVDVFANFQAKDN
jgi:polyisoprenoid-binding protein YceI